MCSCVRLYHFFIYNKDKNYMKCRKKYIKDPYTRKCLKLSLHRTLYHRYIIPYLLGHVTFLNKFSTRDQRKFLVFLHDNMLLSTNNYSRPVRHRSVHERTNLKQKAIEGLGPVLETRLCNKALVKGSLVDRTHILFLCVINI